MIDDLGRRRGRASCPGRGAYRRFGPGGRVIYLPTLFNECVGQMRIIQEEVFGPVIEEYTERKPIHCNHAMRFVE